MGPFVPNAPSFVLAVHKDELIASWRIFSPALHELKARRVRPEPYVYGSSGPPSEAAFASRFGFPGGFAQGHDNEARRQAIAWGKSSVVSAESQKSSGGGSQTGPALQGGSDDGADEEERSRAPPLPAQEPPAPNPPVEGH